MKRLLLTGSGGLIGRHIRDPAYELVRADVDLLEPGAAADLVARARPTHLLHLAWETEPGVFFASPQNVRWLESSLALLRAFAAAGGKRAVIAGSCAEYDWSTAPSRCSERSTPLAPATLYGACKHALHMAGGAFCVEAGVSFAWGRVFFLHGPGEDERRLVPSLARKLLARQPAPMTHGRQVRDFMHSSDVAAAFLALLGSEVEGPVNIASGEPRTLAELGTLIARCAGAPADLLRLGELQERTGEPAALVADVACLREQVGWRPRLSFEQGVADSVEGWRG
ncbi:MAG: NAD-dependent epimerase/dehydratase family protein [Solirubrobacteraceae bacterium]